MYLESPELLAFLIALVTGVSFVFFNMSISIWGPLFYGLVAGLVAGDVNLGIVIGAHGTLFALGVNRFESAAKPDFSIGVLFGVFLGVQIAKTQGITAAMDQGLIAAATVGSLMTMFDLLGRFTTTIFLHKGNKALANRKLKAFQRWHVAGTIPLGLSRFIPVFIGLLYINELSGVVAVTNSIEWIQRGLGVVGASLPAVGLALLLSRMEIAAYWPYMLMGYVLFSWLNVPILGLALVGIACAGLYIRSKKGQLVAKGGK